MDNILYAEISLQMAKAHVGRMSKNPAISEHKEMHIYNPYRDTIRTHCLQRWHKVDFAKIKIILDLKPLVNPKQVRVLLGHTGYYRKFIRYYSDMTYPLEELLREYQEFD